MVLLVLLNLIPLQHRQRNNQQFEKIFVKLGYSRISKSKFHTLCNLEINLQINLLMLPLSLRSTQAEEFDWTDKIPETITSWVLTAFAVNPEKGLAVMKDSKNIKTFQSFFLSPRLPYSVKRGIFI